MIYLLDTHALIWAVLETDKLSGNIKDIIINKKYRMLIWQAITKDMIMISKDGLFEQYKEDGLKIIW